MAGTRHHILPRFLLKGFASRVGRKQDTIFVWVYRNNLPPFEPSTADVGLESHFYGRVGELNADPAITKIEPQFASCIAELRHREDRHIITDERLLEFIVHLTSRTKHLRDTLIDSFDFILQNIFDYFSDYDNWKDWCIEHLKRHPEIITDSLNDALAKLPLSAHKKAMARQKIKRMPVERIIDQMDDDLREFEFLFKALRVKFAEDVHDIGKQGHIKMLLKNLVSAQRVEQYKRLNWYVLRSSEPLILGDVGCLFSLKGNDRYKSLGGTEDEIEAAFLPIASDCMIVGTTKSLVPSIDFKAMNESIAKCSREFFVFSKPSDEMTRLASMIGHESDMITNEELRKVIERV